MPNTGRVMKNPLRALLTGVLTIFFLSLDTNKISAENWPQFRGPGGQGRSPDSKLPLPFGPDQSVVWKMDIPKGHSSPCIWEDMLFLTTFESGQLTTIAINRHEG